MKKFIIILIIIIFTFIIASSIATKIIYDQSFPRYDRQDDSIHAFLRYLDLEESYPRTLHNFDSNENKLQGYLYHQDESLGLIVIAHGIGGGADSYLAYVKWFLDHGWSVFAYDATGSFDSEGKTTKGFPQSLIDLKAALNYISENEDVNDLDVVLFGHSWGGYAVANVLHFNEHIKAVVSVAAPSHANEMIFEQAKKILKGFTYTQRPFLNLYQRLLFGHYASYDAVDAINSHDAHVMLIHGINDDMVAYEGSAIIAKRNQITNPNTIFIRMDEVGRDGHNNLFRSEDALTYIDQINVTYRALYDEHNQQIPYEIKQAFYETVDRFIVQELNDVLMYKIHDFYLKAITN